MNELNVTSLESLEEYSKGAVVELPPFADGQPFVARLKRPSLLMLAKSGKIPNELLNAAGEMFSGTAVKNSRNEDKLSSMCGIFETVCEVSFAEPTMQQIREIGVELTDEQLIFVFNYAQRGTKALKSFRTVGEHNDGTADVKDVQESAERDNVNS